MPRTAINHLVQGDPILLSDADVICQISVINVGEPVPEGWVVLTGNDRISKIARVMLRYQIERGL